MDCLRALIAALALVLLAAAVPSAAAAQTPLEQLGQLSDQARAADEAHAEAAKICDREAMQRHLQTLNRLAREARRVADAARAAGEFATIDPENAARLAAIIATRARVAANRKPENCDERDASRREYFGKVEDTLAAMEAARLRGDCEEFRRLAEKAEFEISLERPVGYVEGEEAEALRRRLREMEGRPCPPQQQPQQPPAQDPRGAGLQQEQQPAPGTQPQPEPQPELDQAQTANLEHARAADRCDPQEMQRRIEEVEAILSRLRSLLIHRLNERRQFEEVQKILEVMRARQAAPCPRHRMPRIEQSRQPQQQQDPAGGLFGRALEQLLAPPGRDGKPVLPQPQVIGVPPPNSSASPDYCDQRVTSGEGDCDANARCPSCPTCLTDAPASHGRHEDYCPARRNRPSECAQPGADPRRCSEENLTPAPAGQRTTLEEIEEYDRAIEEQRKAGEAAPKPETSAPPPP